MELDKIKDISPNQFSLSETWPFAKVQCPLSIDSESQ